MEAEIQELEKFSIPVSPKQSFTEKVIEKATVIIWNQLKDYNKKWNNKFKINQRLIKDCLTSNGNLKFLDNNESEDQEWRVRLNEIFFRLDYPSLRLFHYFTSLENISLFNNRKVIKTTLRLKQDELIDSASCSLQDTMGNATSLHVYCDTGDLFRSFLKKMEEKVKTGWNNNNYQNFNPFECFDVNFVSDVIYNYLESLLPVLSTISSSKFEHKKMTFVLDANVNYFDQNNDNNARDAFMKRRYVTGTALDSVIQCVLICILNSLLDSNYNYLNNPSAMLAKTKKKLFRSASCSSFLRCSSFQQIFEFTLRSSGFINTASKSNITVDVIAAADAVPEADLLIWKLVNEDVEKTEVKLIISGDFDYLLMPFESDSVFYCNSGALSTSMNKLVNLRLYRDSVLFGIVESAVDNEKLQRFFNNKYLQFNWYKIFYFLQLLMGCDYSMITFGYGKTRRKMLNSLISVSLEYIDKHNLRWKMSSQTFRVADSILTAEYIDRIVKAVDTTTSSAVLYLEVIRFCRIFQFLEDMLVMPPQSVVPKVVAIANDHDMNVTSDIAFLKGTITRNIGFLNLDVLNNMCSETFGLKSASKILKLCTQVCNLLVKELHLQKAIGKTSTVKNLKVNYNNNRFKCLELEDENNNSSGMVDSSSSIANILIVNSGAAVDVPVQVAHSWWSHKNLKRKTSAPRPEISSRSKNRKKGNTTQMVSILSWIMKLAQLLEKARRLVLSSLAINSLQ